jgi:hypothetical protein
MMRRLFVLAFIVSIAPQSATAHVVRHNSVPEAYRGTWAPGEGECGASEKTAIVLSAKAYAGPSGSCAIDYVSETATPKGALFSARLLCPTPGAATKKTIVNLMFRSDGTDQVSFGPGFTSLKAYRRCSTAAPAPSKQ